MTFFLRKAFIILMLSIIISFAYEFYSIGNKKVISDRPVIKTNYEQ